jgi:hypothetical protein
MNKASFEAIMVIAIALLVALVAAPAGAAGAKLPATTAGTHIAPNTFYQDPCPSGDERNCDPGGSGGGACEECYAQAVQDRNDGLEACAELGNPPGCTAGVWMAYSQRQSYCDELCAEQG